MSNRSPPGRAPGFTLIEVLAALVVLSVVLGVVFRIFSGGFVAMDRTARTARALTLAESELASVLAADRATIGERLASSGDLRAVVAVHPVEAVGGLVVLEISIRVEDTPVALRTLKLERAP